MILVCDIGGTNMRVAVSRDGVAVDAVRSKPTPRSFEEGIRSVQSMAQELLLGESAQRVVCGVAGTLSQDRNALFRSPHNEGWTGKPLRRELEKAFGVPVIIENDAALAGLGEATSGAGKSFPVVVYFTVSTGIGGARIVNGHIDVNASGFEPGFQIIDESDGVTGHLEGRVSGTAFGGMFGKDSKGEVTESDWNGFEKTLAVGVHNSILHWSPHVVVFGGAITEHERLFSVERVHQRVAELLHAFPNVPVFKKAELGDQGGLRGGLVRVGQN